MTLTQHTHNKVHPLKHSEEKEVYYVDLTRQNQACFKSFKKKTNASFLKSKEISHKTESANQTIIKLVLNNYNAQQLISNQITLLSDVLDVLEMLHMLYMHQF